MKLTFAKIISYGILLIATSLILTQCGTSSPEWEKKNKELIQHFSLTERQLSDLPKTTVESNLQPANVTDLEHLNSVELHPGVKAKIFWGSGIVVTDIELTPNATIPEEV